MARKLDRVIKKIHHLYTVSLQRSSRVSSDLFIDEIGTPRHVKGTPDAHRGVVQMPWPDARHMAAAIHFLVLLPMLVIVIGLKSEEQIDINSEKAESIDESNHVNWDIGSGAVESWNNQSASTTHDRHK